MNQIKIALSAAAIIGFFSSAAFASDADFTLVNKTGYQIDSVFVSPSKADDWGKDVMGKDALADSEKVDIEFPHGGSKCKFDIQVQYNDGDKAEWSDVNLCEWTTITLHWDGKKTTATGE